jgi:hypothetical protein
MPKPRKRKHANPFEQAMGVHGATSATAADMFTNAAARMGFGTPSLGQGAEYTMVRISYDYWQLITLFRNHWISRRIVEVPAQDMVKAWPKLTSDLEPKDLTRVDRAIRRTNTKNNVLTGLTWGRLFGGAGALIVIDGQENELDQPLDLESIRIGAYKGVIPFDRWAGITPVGDVCTDINRPLDFNKPEMYEVRVNGGSAFQVHASRLLRFLGPTVPTPEVEAQSYWGISVLEPTYESITMLDNMYWNILSLSFRANLLGMKFPQLAELLSGLGSSQLASQKFEQRMSAVNHLMSNNSLIPLPADGGLESTQYSFGGLSDVLQLFQLNLAGAAQMPVTRLFGRTYSGLGQAGDGDERIYEEKIATDQSTYMVPQLEKLYPVVCMSELGEVPDDLDLNCPSIRVLDEKEKAELAKSVADTTTVYLNGGIMSPRKVAQEVKQSSDITGIGTNLDDEFIAKLSDDVQSEGELGDGLFGGEGAGLNEADSPGKAIKAENEEGKEDAKKQLLAKAGEAQDTAPAMDTLPSGLSAGEKVLVNGKLLTVRKVTTGTTDLFGEPTVQVLFDTGEIVAYRPNKDVKVRAEDAEDAEDAEESVLFRDLAIGEHFLWRFGSEYLTLKKTGKQKAVDPKDGVEQFISLNYPTRRVPATGRTKATDSAQKFHAPSQTNTSKSKCGATARRGGTLLVATAEEWARLPQTEKCSKCMERDRATDDDGASSMTQRAIDFELYHAMPVRVESRQGTVRSGITPDGRSWSVNMPADYGFIDGAPAADEDSLDCYIGPAPESSNVYVVDQYDINGKRFDEHKVMLGYHTQESALEDYMLGHHLSKKTFAAITPFTMPMFRRWIATADMTAPCSPAVQR